MLDDHISYELLSAAREAALSAYCPHSNFRVGAAVLANGKVFTGCNIENDSFSLTICAERVAVFKAVAAGNLEISAIAITCLDAVKPARTEEVISCGACRQVLSQFGDDDMVVLLDGAETILLKDMLPKPFKLLASQTR